MNEKIKNLCNKIRAASKEERPPLVRDLIREVMAQDESQFGACLAHIESSLGSLPMLDDIRDDLRKERDPEKIRGLMAAALKLRTKTEVAAQ